MSFALQLLPRIPFNKLTTGVLDTDTSTLPSIIVAMVGHSACRWPRQRASGDVAEEDSNRQHCRRCHHTPMHTWRMEQLRQRDAATACKALLQRMQAGRRLLCCCCITLRLCVCKALPLQLQQEAAGHTDVLEGKPAVPTIRSRQCDFSHVGCRPGGLQQPLHRDDDAAAVPRRFRWRLRQQHEAPE